MGSARNFLAMCLPPVLAWSQGACFEETSHCPVALVSPCQVRTFEIDNNGDSITNTRYDYAYDDEGKLLTVSGDGAGAGEDDPQVPDGTLDSLVRNFYDQDGVLTSSEHDAPLGIWRETYTYNTLGLRTVVEFDYERDDTIDVTYNYEYNDARQLIRQENTNASLETYKYEHGALVETEKSFEDALQFRIQYTNSECGNARLETTVLPDGSISSHRVFSYSETGILTEETRLTSQGAPAESTVHSYDGFGNKVRSELDFNLDGTPNQVLTWSYTCPTTPS